MKRINTLVVDNNKKFLKKIKTYLEKIGKNFTVSISTSTSQALNEIKKNKLDVIISNTDFSDTNGSDFISLFKAKSDYTIFIIFTDSGSEEHVIKALNLGVDYYLKREIDNESQFEILISEIEKKLLMKRAEKALHESEERFRVIYEKSRDGIVLIDTKSGQIIDGNSEFEKQTGRSLDELKKLKIWEICPLKERDLAEKKFREISQNKLGGSSILEFMKPDGGIVPIIFDSSLINFNGKNYILSMTKDLTEQKKIEEELSKERKLAQKYLNIMGGIIVIIDKDQNINLINEKGCEILGYTKDEIIGKNWFDNVIPKKVRNNVKETFKKVLEEEPEVRNFENYVLTKNGDERLISWNNSVIKDVQGTVIATISSGVDITFQRMIHSELIESEKRYRFLFDNLPIAVGISNDIGMVLRANKAMEVLTGYHEELYRVNIANTYFNLDDRTELLKILEKNNSANNFETKMLHSDGSTYHAKLNINTFEEEGEKLFLTVLEDITAIKQLEQEQDPLLAALEKVEESIVIVDFDGKILYVNSFFEDFTGYSANEVIGATPALMRYFDDEYNEDFYKNVREETVKGNVWKGRVKIKCKEGRIRIGERIITPIRNDSGEIIRFVAATRDITDRIALEDKLKMNNEKLVNMFKKAPLPYQSLDNEGNIIDVNNFWLDIFQYTRKDVIGKWFGEILAPDYIKKFKKSFLKFIKKGSMENTDFNILRKDGSMISAKIDGIILSDITDRNRVYSQCVILNIVDEGISLDQLTESQLRMSHIVESTKIGTWDWNLKTDEIILNKNYVEMLGYTLDEIEPNLSSIRKIIHSENSCVVEMILNSNIEDRAKHFQVEHRAKCKSGEWKWILCSGKIIAFDDKGKPLRATGIHLDITKQKREDQKIIDTEIRYRTILDNINEVYFITNRDGSILDFNQKGEEIFGYSRDELLRLNVTKLYADKNGRKTFQAAIEKQGELKDYKLKMKKKNGTIFDCSLTAFIRRDKDRRILGYIGILSDISQTNP